MQNFFASLLYQIYLTVPFFLLGLLGYGLIRWGKWPRSASEAMNRFVFSVSLPGMLFRLMIDFSSHRTLDARLLIAFFGGSLIVFVLGRIIAAKFFKLDGVAGSVFGMCGIYSNNGMLGLPIAKVMLGDKALPAIALVLVFNSLILWSLASASVEWARTGTFSLKGFTKTVKSVLTNPLIIAILSGLAFSLTGLTMPHVIMVPLDMISNSATFLALIALGMGMAQYGVREGWEQSAVICTIKLLVQPFVVWAIAVALNLPAIDMQAIVLLASMALGVNMYLMSQKFGALQGPTASSLVLSTLFASITTPIILTLIGAAR